MTIMKETSLNITLNRGTEKDNYRGDEIKRNPPIISHNNDTKQKGASTEGEAKSAFPGPFRSADVDGEPYLVLMHAATFVQVENRSKTRD